MSKVSIIMPVYNGAKYIREAISSILAQTFKDWELIVVDDGSTDETESVVASLDIPLKFLKQHNSGPSAARNLGLQLATGDYVVFLDADDTLDPSFLDLTVKELDRLGDTVVGVCCGWVYTDQVGQELYHTRVTRAGYLGLQDFLITNLFPIHAFLTPRPSLLSVNGFDTNIFAMEDWDLWLRLIAKGGQFYAIPICLARYRLHGFTNSHQPDRMRSGRLSALEKIFSGNDLQQDIQLLKARVFGKALIQSSVELYAAERDNEAIGNFCEAIRLCPDLLEEDETLYAVICAQQPVGYKSTGEFLDLAFSERRLLNALRAGFQIVRSSDLRLSQRVHSRGYQILGDLAHRQGHMKMARHYLFTAIKYDADCIYHGNALWSLAKSVIGPKWLKILRGPKEHKFV